MFRHHLFKSWVALSTGKITIQRMIIRETKLCHPVDSDLSTGQHYPPFEQLGPDCYLFPTCYVFWSHVMQPGASHKGLPCKCFKRHYKGHASMPWNSPSITLCCFLSALNIESKNREWHCLGLLPHELLHLSRGHHP